MFHHINGDRLDVAILKDLSAGQLKSPISGQGVLDPCNGAANRTFGTAEIDGNVLHCAVFAVILQGDEEFIANGSIDGFSAIHAVCRMRLAGLRASFGTQVLLFR